MLAENLANLLGKALVGSRLRLLTLLGLWPLPRAHLLPCSAHGRFKAVPGWPGIQGTIGRTADRQILGTVLRRDHDGTSDRKTKRVVSAPQVDSNLG
jgi:hypothetical protein